MAIFTLDRTSWTQIGTVARRVQVFGGRARIADSATPAAGDWQVRAEGEIFDATATLWAQAHDATQPDKPATTIVTIAV